MKSLKKFGRRQEKLEKVYQALMSIQVTSVESERSFSACGLLVTKLRTRLRDSMVNDLSILRSHFLEDDRKTSKKKEQKKKSDNVIDLT